MAVASAPITGKRQHEGDIEVMQLALRLPFHVRKVRLRLALAAVTAVLSVGGVLAFAPAASANTRSNWSAVIDGVEVGWTQNHAWLITSYANAIARGSGAVAEVVCDAVSDGGIGPLCDHVVEEFVGELMKGETRLTNHGLWVAIYPEAWGRYYVKDGRY